ncbi:MAG: T9SS type A sorting domain-containing protein [Prolixibacteraceae bacterium]|nr:T9SS type A sorting domain-containing protein [Prolixibacteraceae bacterium]
MKNPKPILLGIFVLASLFAYGQTTSLQLVSSAGETFKNSNYQLDWSIGEILTETYNGNLNMLTQGLHQGKYTITSVDQIKNLQLEISAFPNPATDFVLVKMASEKFENFRFSLSDINGKVLQNGRFTSNLQQINLAGKATGAYFLNVISDQTTVKTFKIIKSN